MTKAVKVYTNDSLKDILKLGGSGYWRLDTRRVKKCEYVVAIRNPDGENSESSVKARSAFLIGKIQGVQPHRDNRSIIMFSEYALVDVPRCWDGSRNPVAYTTVEELGINLDKLEGKWLMTGETRTISPATPGHLTIEQAKLGLAATMGVRPDQVEITIRG